MDKNVLITITGVQKMPDDVEDSTEITVCGEYYNKKGRHFLLYEETDPDNMEITRNITRFDQGLLEVTKKGAVNTHMLFEDGKKFVTVYATSFGEVLMGFDTASVSLLATEDSIQVQALYQLEAEGELVADCTLKIRVVPRKAGSCRLS